MKAFIAGTGSHTPDKILTNADLEKIVETSDEWIVTRSGIRERHIADKDTASSDIAAEASKKALQKAKINAKDLQAIICATATPDMLFPSTACLVQHKIGAGKITAFDIVAGCTGFVYALATAECYVKSGFDNVLVIGVDLLSRITNYTDRSTCVLFGDAAGAVVLRRTDKDRGIMACYTGADGSFDNLLYMPAGGSRKPPSYETVDKHMHTIHMAGNEVFKVAVRAMAKSALKTLEQADVSPDDISLLVPHQANIRIIEATAKRLNMPMDKVAVNIDKYGNTSAASIPLALDQAIQAGRVTHGDLILLVAFGAGFTWGGILFRL